jgi:hypothetical protein
MPAVRCLQDVESKDNFVSVIIGASGAIKKGSDQILHLLQGQPSSIELQITLMITAHVICQGMGKPL